MEDAVGIRRHPLTDEEIGWMRLAVNLGKRSQSEPGKQSPKVGAVVVRDSALLYGSFRGETGEGHHAEFCALTQLEGISLTGATVYTTLEPCTRRNPPKTPCAVRLVDRGVGTVFIGMYDPDPRIYREGWRVLRDAGVELRDFDTALREEIKVDNSEFIGQFRHAVGIKGKARFDYTQNDGRFALYSDDRSVRFETRWTPAGSGCIYPIDSQFNVAQTRYATEFSQIDDPSALDFDSYTCLLRVGQVGVFRNQEGYALIRVEKVLHPDYGDDRFELFFSYELRLRVPGDTLQ